MGLSGTPCVSVRISLSPGTQSTRASSFVYEGEGEGEGEDESEDEKARSPAPPWNPALLATPARVAETEGAEAAEEAEAAASEATRVPHGEARPSTSSRSDSSSPCSSPVSVEVYMLETGTSPPSQPSKGRAPSGGSVEDPGCSSEAAEMVASSLCRPNPCVHERLPAHASNLVTQPHAPASSLERCLRCCSPLL